MLIIYCISTFRAARSNVGVNSGIRNLNSYDGYTFRPALIADITSADMSSVSVKSQPASKVSCYLTLNAGVIIVLIEYFA